MQVSRLSIDKSGAASTIGRLESRAKGLQAEKRPSPTTRQGHVFPRLATQELWLTSENGLAS